MTIPISFATATVVVHRPIWVEDHGAMIPSAATEPPFSIPGCIVQPETSEGDSTEGTYTSQRQLIHAPADADLRAEDLLELPGVSGRWQITAEPQRWPSPTGALAHMEARASRYSERSL